MARNKSEAELRQADRSGWVSKTIPTGQWTHVTITYDTTAMTNAEFNIPTDHGVEVYGVREDGSLKLIRTIQVGAN